MPVTNVKLASPKIDSVLQKAIYLISGRLCTLCRRGSHSRMPVPCTPLLNLSVGLLFASSHQSHVNPHLCSGALARRRRPSTQFFGDPIFHGVPSRARRVNSSCLATCLAFPGVHIMPCRYDRRCIGPTVLQALRKQTVLIHSIKKELEKRE